MSSLTRNIIIPSTASVLSTYTAFAAWAMLARTVLNELQNLTNQLVPKPLRDILIAKLGVLFRNVSDSSQITLTIDEFVNGSSVNEIFTASETYLATKISPSNRKLKASKTRKETDVSVTVDEGEIIVDVFDGITLTWQFSSAKPSKAHYDDDDDDDCYDSNETSEKRAFRLSFDKQFKDTVLRDYLSHVIDAAKSIDEEKKIVKLFSSWDLYSKVDFRHPSTFETLAMDEKAKREIVEDLDRFVKRKEFYDRVGKAWKRGYLLYGPPGTGKSSLIAAMANHLRYDVCDLDLKKIDGNHGFRRLLVSIASRTIIVIEDIDCTVELKDRELGGSGQSDSQLTLSGLLNFIDGLWSSCGDERLIVVTTNYKERLDPALLRPGRMDMHIHMSYCTPDGFKTLAFNYLRIKTHRLFGDIEEILKEVEVTPAEVAEDLMRTDDADEALEGLLGSLRRRKERKLEEQVTSVVEEEGDGKEVLEVKEIGKNKGVKRNKKGGKGRKKRAN